MTSSKSSKSRRRWLIVLAMLTVWLGSAEAGRRRIVVLEFEGPKAEVFHEDVVKLIKKTHTVLSTEKWQTTAEELAAEGMTEKSIKKVAKKLKVDGVVTGKIEKRRDEYIVRLKLRGGTSGAIEGSMQIKSGTPKLDAQAQRDVKDELIASIGELEVNAGDEEAEEEEAPAKKKKKGEEVEEEAPKKKSGFARKAEEEEEAAPVKKKKGKAEEVVEEAPVKKKGKVEEEEEAAPAKKKKTGAEEKAALATKKAKDEEAEEPAKDSEDEEETTKKTASAEDEDSKEAVEEEAPADADAAALRRSPGRRAMDAAIGVSFVRRNLSFDYDSMLANPPPGYKQSIPVAGAIADVTFYPLAFNRRNKGILSGIGLNLLYDRVLFINSKKAYADMSGAQQVAILDTTEERWSVGVVMRYPLGSGPKAPVVGGKLSYGRQKFTVKQELPNRDPTDIPDVQYSMISPTAFVRYPVIAKLIANLDLTFHGILDTGMIQQFNQYGRATVTAFEVEAGLDYMITGKIFARAGVRYASFGFKFKGDPQSQSATRDGDGMDQDVAGANDNYLGGIATVGYLY